MTICHNIEVISIIVILSVKIVTFTPFHPLINKQISIIPQHKKDMKLDSYDGVTKESGSVFHPNDYIYCAPYRNKQY